MTEYAISLNPPRVTEQLPDGGEALYSLTADGRIVTEVVVRQALGVSSRDLRRRSPTAAARAYQEFRRADTHNEPDLRIALGLRLPAEGRDERRTLRLVQTAALYVKALEEGEKAPNEYVARSQKRTAAHVRDDLKRARDAGLLESAPGRGEPGGGLTEGAVQFLVDRTLRVLDALVERYPNMTGNDLLRLEAEHLGVAD